MLRANLGQFLDMILTIYCHTRTQSRLQDDRSECCQHNKELLLIQ